MSFNDDESRTNLLKLYLGRKCNNHQERILQEKTLKDAHIYCILNNLSSQEFGPLLEKYIRHHHDFKKISSSECIGDCSKNGFNVEIKVSLGGK